MDPRDHKGEEGVIEAAEDGMAGRHSRLDVDVHPEQTQLMVLGACIARQYKGSLDYSFWFTVLYLC